MTNQNQLVNLAWLELEGVFSGPKESKIWAYYDQMTQRCGMMILLVYDTLVLENFH